MSDDGGLTQEVADDWRWRLLEMGVHAAASIIAPPDAPWHVVVKLGDHKWVDIDSPEELTAISAWLRDRLPDPAEDDDFPPWLDGGSARNVGLAYSPTSKWHEALSALAPSFIWMLAHVSAGARGVQRDKRGRTRCHGCGNYHIFTKALGGEIFLCHDCAALTYEFHPKEVERIGPKPSSDLPVKVGSSVQHKHFGEGVVLGVGWVGDDYEVAVRFTKDGPAADKILLWKYAGLRVKEVGVP